METVLMLRATGGTDPGKERNNNEDRLHCDPERGIFMVVDGVGGQMAGEKAAEIALGRIRTRLERRTGSVTERMREAITVANNEIHRVSQTNRRWHGMACVLTVAIIENRHATVGHVGDSRLYKLHRGQIRKITHDHSPVGELEDCGKLSEADAMCHPQRNEVYRVVGGEFQEPDDREFIEIIEVPFEPDSALLLCTDGLTDQVTSPQIAEVISRNAGNPEKSVQELIDLANNAGGKDNISAIVIEGERFFAVSGKNRVAPSRRKGEPGLAASENAVSSLPRLLRARSAVFVYGAIAGVALVTALQSYFDVSAPRELLLNEHMPRKLVVDPAIGEFGSISRALENAQAGDVIEVAPGEYFEQIRLKDGVTVVSRKPLEAVLKAPRSLPQDKIGVVAQGIRAARLTGFKVQSDSLNPLAVGIRIADSEVQIEDVEIAGATDAGVIIEGNSTAALTASYVHDSGGAGVVIRGDSTPTLKNNVILFNGKPKRAAGISISERANPLLQSNVISGNGAGELSNSSRASRPERLRGNFLFPIPPISARERGNRRH